MRTKKGKKKKETRRRIKRVCSANEERGEGEVRLSEGGHTVRYNMAVTWGWRSQ